MSLTLMHASDDAMADIAVCFCFFADEECGLDWLQSLKHSLINVSYHILEASLTLMALF